MEIPIRDVAAHVAADDVREQRWHRVDPALVREVPPGVVDDRKPPRPLVPVLQEIGCLGAHGNEAEVELAAQEDRLLRDLEAIARNR